MAAQTPAATDLKSAFKVGDKVTWKSQANGHWSTKTGEVVAVIPADTSLRNVLENGDVTSKKYAGMNRMTGSMGFRHHESFLVAVPAKGKGKPNIYWPVASSLELAQTKA